MLHLLRHVVPLRLQRLLRRTVLRFDARVSLRRFGSGRVQEPRWEARAWSFVDFRACGTSSPLMSCPFSSSLPPRSAEQASWLQRSHTASFYARLDLGCSLLQLLTVLMPAVQLLFPCLADRLKSSGWSSGRRRGANPAHHSDSLLLKQSSYLYIHGRILEIDQVFLVLSSLVFLLHGFPTNAQTQNHPMRRCLVGGLLCNFEVRESSRARRTAAAPRQIPEPRTLTP